MDNQRRASLRPSVLFPSVMISLVVLSCICGSGFGQDHRYWVNLKEHANVSSKYVYLRDVAAEMSDTELGDVPLVQAPAQGSTFRLDRESIGRFLRKRLGSAARIEVQGAESVLISRVAQKLSREQLVRTLERFVRSQLDHGARVEVEIRRPTDASFLIPEQSNIRIKALGPIKSGTTSGFRVDCLVGGTVLKSFVVAARVRLYGPVVVAARDLPPRSQISKDDVRIEERSIERLLGEPLRDLSEAVGLQNRSTIRRGSVLTKRMLKRLPLVQRGDVVRLVVAYRGVQAETLGRALQAGGLDDMVLVRNATSGRTVRARVIGRGQVVVTP